MTVRVRSFAAGGKLISDQPAVARQKAGERYLPNAWHLILENGKQITGLDHHLDEQYAGWRDLPERVPVHIEGRRWFQRGPGNTYHSVRIFKGGEQIAYLPFAYGYGDQFLQTALDWLKANGHAPADAEYGTLYLREKLGGTYSVQDVARKRDL